MDVDSVMKPEITYKINYQKSNKKHLKDVVVEEIPVILENFTELKKQYKILVDSHLRKNDYRKNQGWEPLPMN